MNELTSERRRRLTHRALPALGGLAGVALLAGALVGSSATSASERTAADFTEAWERGDLRAMHALLSDEAQSAYPLKRFRAAYRRAADTSTQTGLMVEDPSGERDGDWVVPVVVETKVFGRQAGELLVPVSEERVEWEPRLVFPELRRGERLARRSVPPERATLLSRNRRVLAEGPADARTSPLVGIADSIAGSMEPEETAEERAGPVRARLPARLASRAERTRGGLRGAPARPPGRRAARRPARARDGTAARRRAGAHVDRAEDPGGGRARARGAVRRNRGTRPEQRRDPRAGRDRVLGPPAAGLDLQDHHHDGGARGGARQAQDRVPGRELRADRRRRARERQRRVLRGQLPRELRPFVQLGVRPARRRGGLGEARRDGRALRLELGGHASPARSRARCRPRARSSPRSRSARPPSASSRRSRRRCSSPPSRR